METTLTPGKRDGFILPRDDTTHTDAHSLKEALTYAALHSDDQDTKNGALLLTPTHLVYAANMLPSPSITLSDERTSRPLKYQYLEHAERMALLRAAAAGIKTEGAVLYCPWYACVDCARAIIVSGVKEVVGLKKVQNFP